MTALTRLDEWTVPADEIDHLNHMSTLFYGWRADAAAVRLLETLGAGQEALAAAGLTARIVDRLTLFRREQMAGAPLTMAGAVVAVQPERLDLHVEMAAAATGELAATFRLGVELQDLATRAAAAIPERWRDAAAAARIEPPARSQPRTLPLDRLGLDLRVDDFDRIGIAPHLRREITAEACDPEGFLAPPPRPRIGAREGPYNQGIMDEVWGTVPGFVWPAVEMRTLNPRAPRQGDVLETYTALLSVSHKIIHSGVWTFEARSGALTSLVHQVNVFFNFATRRTQDMPGEVRERLTRLVTPALAPHRPS